MPGFRQVNWCERSKTNLAAETRLLQCPLRQLLTRWATSNCFEACPEKVAASQRGKWEWLAFARVSIFTRMALHWNATTSSKEGNRRESETVQKKMSCVMQSRKQVHS